MHEGYYSTLLGLKGAPAAGEEILTSRDIHLVELTGGRLHVAHLSTLGAIEAVRRAKARGLAVTCEVTPHHIALTDEAVQSFSTDVKMNPPLRSEDHRRALVDALRDGTIDAIATDHAPHHPDEKRVEFDLAPFGVIGLETAFAVCYETLVKSKAIKLAQLVDLMSTRPARTFNLPGGTLKPGSAGDVAVIDLEGSTEYASFRSRSQNSPWRGRTLPTRVAATVVGGAVRYEDRGSAAALVGKARAAAAKGRGVRR
jgi:dihydroorotase